MAAYQLTDEGFGNYRLSGQVGFATVGKILRESEDLFSDHTKITLNLSDVESTDSAGLALLLEWIHWTNSSMREIRFTDVPDKILKIARTSDVEEFLRAGERWAGFIDDRDPE